MARSWIHAFQRTRSGGVQRGFFQGMGKLDQEQCGEKTPPEELKNVDKQPVFTAPARMVRVNKGAMEGILKTKKPNGHTDPGLGSFRSDAPTTLWSAVQLTKIIASTHRWPAYIFDVSTAFLSGKEVERLLYMKAPIDGFVQKPFSGELLRVCKSANSLSEAPRLWYSEPRSFWRKSGFQSWPWPEQVFFWSKNDQVVAILCLHVDDGLLVASQNYEIPFKRRSVRDFHQEVAENRWGASHVIGNQNNIQGRYLHWWHDCLCQQDRNCHCEHSWRFSFTRFQIVWVFVVSSCNWGGQHISSCPSSSTRHVTWLNL